MKKLSFCKMKIFVDDRLGIEKNERAAKQQKIASPPCPLRVLKINLFQQ